MGRPRKILTPTEQLALDAKQKKQERQRFVSKHSSFALMETARRTLAENRQKYEALMLELVALQNTQNEYRRTFRPIAAKWYEDEEDSDNEDAPASSTEVATVATNKKRASAVASTSSNGGGSTKSSRRPAHKRLKDTPNGRLDRCDADIMDRLRKEIEAGERTLKDIIARQTEQIQTLSKVTVALQKNFAEMHDKHEEENRINYEMLQKGQEVATHQRVKVHMIPNPFTVS